MPSHSSLLHDIALLQEALIAAEKNASAAHATAGKQAELITKLKKELEEKDEQIEALRSQLKDYQMYILRHHKGSKQLAAQTHAFKRAIGARAAAKNSREVAGKQAKAAASSGGGGACTEAQPSQLALWEDGDGVPKLVNILHLNEDEANVTISVPSFDPGVANEERVVPKDQLTIDEDIVEEGVEDISKQRANFIVSEMTGVLCRPGVDHARQILRAFTNSKVVSTTLQSILSSEERQPGLSGELQIMWRMMVRLREAVCDLKNSTSDLLLHHAYSAIMTALAPGSVDALPWELNAMTKSLGLSSKKGLHAGVKHKDAILSEGGGVWFNEEREERKDSFTKERPADAHQVESFWYSNTAREAGRAFAQSKCDKSERWAHHIFCTVCSKQRGECTCTFVRQPQEQCADCGCAEAPLGTHECGCVHDCSCKAEHGPSTTVVCQNCYAAGDACECAREKGVVLCCCFDCQKPREEDVVSGAQHCKCETFKSNCIKEEPGYVQERPDQGKAPSACSLP